jgi:hypothetical protein
MKKRKNSIKKLSKSSQPLVKIDREETKTTVKRPTAADRKSFLERILEWFDDYGLLVIAGFLFAFIPLYPKLPLADLIPGYIVRLRLEDLLVGGALLVYGIQLLRRKAVWKTPFTWLIVAYAVVGLLSTLSGIFITKTIPPHTIHVMKSMLHYFRYLEYFSLFFIAFSAIKSKRDFQIILSIFAITVVAISVYGYGQKYFYWPLYSTMNREFSKGQRLYLTEHARVQSTFGGHYDMAGYLAVALPMFLAAFFAARRWKIKLPLFFVFTVGLWLLIMSASRASFAGFFLGVVLLIPLFALQQSTLLKKFSWLITRGTLIMLFILMMFFQFGESIAERFSQVLQPFPVVKTVYDNTNDIRKNILKGNFSGVLGKYFNIQPPENGYAVTAEEQESPGVLVSSDQRPVPKPADVYVDVPDIVTISTVSATGVATTSTVEKDRTYSENALKYGLSMAIRLDTLWPQAISGFQRNPLLGSGYATLTKSEVGQFTEAESTDNNFLRTLGETGLLGFITFYSTILVAFYFCGRIMRFSNSSFARAIAIGYVTGSFALLINALYIDVYASSKIAFTYWALSGFVVAYFVRELAESRMRPKLPDEKVEQAVLPKPKQ